MSFRRHVAAGVGWDIDLEPLLQHFERGKHHAGFRPEARNDERFPSGVVHGLTENRIEPSVHRRAIDDVVLRKQLGHFRHERPGERVLGHRGNDGGNFEQLRRLRQAILGMPGWVMVQDDP
jgi:hypothetical protein